jgi:hypothetical protein
MAAGLWPAGAEGLHPPRLPGLCPPPGRRPRRPGGWAAEYPRDVWRLHNLGFAGRQTPRFGQIPQPWLQDLAKRRVRWRLSTGLCLEASRRAVRALARFGQFLASPAVSASQLADIDRPVLERYLADLHAEMAGSQRQGSHIGLLSAFFQAIRQHGWDDTLPASATFFTTDYPKRAERLPRALAEHVMTQIEHPANLARWDNPAYQLITLILIRCGLRISDGCGSAAAASSPTPTAPPTCATSTTR